jgi:branched-subunit amino acid aminotransferase/4-amino-4-deoxychorismate lyase
MVEGGRLETPHMRTGLLPGITRQTVCELAQALGCPVEETTLRPDRLRAADEVFLTSSVRGIMPVTRLDGVVVGTGRAGPVTRRLHEAYLAHVAAAARRPRSVEDAADGRSDPWSAA